MSHYEERLERDLSRIKQQLAVLAHRVEDAIGDAVHALLSGNDKLAHMTVLEDQSINRASRALDRMCHSFIALHLPSAGHLRLMSAIIRANLGLERIGDYAVTICRESVQLARRPEGLLARELELMAGESRQMLKQSVAAFIEGKADKVFRILFLDEDNSLLGPMAEAIARKNFPRNGEYRSAGRGTAPLEPALIDFLKERGIDLSQYQPKALDLSHQELAELHVIVSLQGPAKSYLEMIPFHTALLDWDIAGARRDAPPEQRRQQYETLYREIAVQLSNLMAILTGEEAS